MYLLSINIIVFFSSSLFAAPIDTAPLTPDASPAPTEMHKLSITLAADNKWSMDITGIPTIAGPREGYPSRNGMAWQEIKTVNVTLNGAGPWVVAISALDYGVIAGFWAHVLLDGEIYTSTGIPGTKFVVNNYPTTGWKEMGFDDSLWAHNFTSTPKCHDSIWENVYGEGFYNKLNMYAGTGNELNAATWYPDCVNTYKSNYFRLLISLAPSELAAQTSTVTPIIQSDYSIVQSAQRSD